MSIPPRLLAAARRGAFALVALASASSAVEARAAEPVATSTLEAVARTLGFLESAPREDSFAIGVVYAADAPGAAAAAADVGARLSRLSGPRRAALRATSYSVDDLARTTDHIDALFLMPGLADESGRVAQVIRQRQVLSLSSDPSCISAGFCAVMVNADRDVEIVIDTGLVDEVGAQFSTVFTMMVDRR